MDGGNVECHGSAAVQLMYQGQKMKTRLLITPKLKNEVILLKTVLSYLSVISNSFLNVLTKKESLKSGLQASLGGILGAGLSQKIANMEVSHMRLRTKVNSIPTTKPLNSQAPCPGTVLRK